MPTNKQLALTDFAAFLPDHTYIFLPLGTTWTAAGVKACLSPIPVTKKGQPVLCKAGPRKGKPQYVPATTFLHRNCPVHHRTWAPGFPTLIHNRLLNDGGWLDKKNVTTFNAYRAPIRVPGDPKKAGPWLDLVRRVYPDDADHFLDFVAHCVQHPGASRSITG